MDSSIARRRVIRGLGAASIAGAASIGSVAAGAQPAVAATTAAGINVRDYGAVGDGVADDTSPVKLAIDAAKGDLVYFPAGTYLLDRLNLNATADLVLGDGAVLRHKSGSTGGYMLALNGTFLRIRGGTLDGNKQGQSMRTMLITASLQTGKRLVLEGVNFINTLRAAVYLQSFGGTCVVQGCRFTDQAQHDGTTGNTTAIVHVASGEGGARPVLRFNHNDALFTDAPTTPGSNPGGVFLAAGADAENALATFEAIGNYFLGYGQNLAGNFISALHTYPAAKGVRWVGNFFEKSAYAAMSAKSVEDFVCTENVIVDGLVNSANTSSEGAICYAPSYHAGSVAYPRAVISNNIIDNPGGEPTRTQNGISVFGSPESLVSEAVIANNVMGGVGMGVLVSYAKDVLVDGNVISNTSLSNGAHGGIRFDRIDGTVSVSNNRITTKSGYGLFLVYGVDKCVAMVKANSFTQEVSGIYAVVVRGARVCHFTSNTIDAVSHALTVRGYDTAKMGSLYWDSSNAIFSGAFVPMFSEISNVFGEFTYVNSPAGQVSAGEIGTVYKAKNGAPGQVMWVATAVGTGGWRAIG